ncbi:MAG: hypothetical protein HQ488_00565 [Parcubacteria group bacterium]|nr:hypothetical protein [Parcubacteria group bacterium]
MYLVIASQDISNLTLALLDGGDLVQSEDFFVPPEKHLVSIDETLHKWKMPINTLKGVIVVTGPGSFTASRVSVTLANSIAMTQDIPIWGITNPQNISVKDLVGSLDLSKTPQGTFVLPDYNKEPHITLSKKTWG